MRRLQLMIAILLLVAAWSPADAVSVERRLRRPVALELSSDGRWLYTANRDSGSISVVDLSIRSVADEIEIGGRLTDLAALDDGHLLALDEQRHQLVLLTGGGRRWRVASRLDVAPYPARLQVDRAAGCCFISSLWSQVVTKVDLSEADGEEQPRLRVAQELLVDFEPLEMCLASDGKRLIIAGSFRSVLAVVDTEHMELLATKEISGHNIRGLTIRGDDRLLVTQQMLSPLAHSTRDDVHWGNMLSNLLVSLPLNAVFDPRATLLQRRAVVHLGEPGNAAGDPGPINIGPTGNLAVVLSGVNEVALGREADGSGFRRVAVGRRPIAALSTRDGRLLVANMFSDSITIVDVDGAQPTAQVVLGPQPELSPEELGETLFFDSRLSLDGWMSCHSCHTDGHSSGQLNDNLSDGSFGAPKRVLSLLGVGQTGPWAWNGEMEKLDQQVLSSIQNTMQGPVPTEEQVAALAAYLRTLPAPRPPAQPTHRRNDSQLRRGRELFQSLRCQSCHTPPAYTSHRSFDVGLKDAVGNHSFNPPSLRGIGRRRALFHDASASSLMDVLQNHGHQLNRELSASELDALYQFLNSI